ncbi:MAG: DUF4178 domain-containing protein [Bacteroidia bacterium]|nr:DUF4178 domain-containing protein [Bacteroidia bacterium]
MGQVFYYHAHKYEIVGRVVYKSADGYLWQEWYLFSPKAKPLWLSEAEGEYYLFRGVSPPEQFSLSQVRQTGRFLSPAGTLLYMEEEGQATPVYFEGELPFLPNTESFFHYLDLYTEDGKVGYSVIWDEEEIEFYKGHIFQLPPSLQTSKGRKRTFPKKSSWVGVVTYMTGFYVVVALVGLIWVRHWPQNTRGIQVVAPLPASPPFRVERRDTLVIHSPWKVYAVKARIAPLVGALEDRGDLSVRLFRFPSEEVLLEGTAELTYERDCDEDGCSTVEVDSWEGELRLAAKDTFIVEVEAELHPEAVTSETRLEVYHDFFPLSPQRLLGFSVGGFFLLVGIMIVSVFFP